MTKLALYLVAATMVATAFVAPSHAAPPPGGPTGRKCGFHAITDVTREAGWQTGDIDAGPLVTGEAGTLVCSIHVNNNTHDGSALVTETVGDTAGLVAVMAPRPLNYPATMADDVSLCTTWVGASGTLYWASPNPAVPTDQGHWDSTSSTCGVAATVWVSTPDGVICVYW